MGLTMDIAKLVICDSARWIPPPPPPPPPPRFFNFFLGGAASPL